MAAKKWVYTFQEGNATMRDLLGGKGANLAEMTRVGLPVPPGFTVTTEACNDYLASGGQFDFRPKSVEDGWVEYTFEVREKEPLRLLVEATRGPDSGKYQVFLNGVKVGKPIDLYGSQGGIDDVQLMDFWPEPGKYTLRLVCVGKNKDSEGIRLGVNSVRLRERRPRVKAFGYDKDKDWRSDQVLYE